MSEKPEEDDERSVTPETPSLSDVSGSEEEGSTESDEEEEGAVSKLLVYDL